MYESELCKKFIKVLATSKYVVVGVSVVRNRRVDTRRKLSSGG